MNKLIIYIKREILISSILLFIFGFAGCKKFLTRDDPSHFTTQNFYKTAGDAQSAINAIYSSLSPIYDQGAAGWNGSPWEMLEFATGTAENASPQAAFSNDVLNLRMDADNGYLDTWWNSSYQGIANANQAIRYVPDIEMDQTQKSNLLAEAYFLRAYYYFNLVRIFGDIPLITTPQTFDLSELNVPRTDQKEVYNLIVSDLTTAETSSLPFSDNDGRVTLGAIKSLLASVYLTMSGYPLQEDHYKDARDKAKEVIDSRQFSLFNSYESLRDPNMNNQQEFIFEIQYDLSTRPSPLQTQLLPSEHNISAYSDETGSIHPTSSFVNSYAPVDRRRQEKQFFYTNYTSASDRSVTVNFGGYYIYKFFDETANLATARSGLNIPLLRYPEVLLTFAEADNEVNNSPSADAYNAINTVRARAELPALSGLDQNDFREAVWTERWHELCFENKSWFDMVRTRKVLNESNDTFDDFVGHAFSYGPILANKDLLFPIPDKQRHINPNLNPQNPGYD